MRGGKRAFADKKSTQLKNEMIAFIRPAENEKRLQEERKTLLFTLRTYQTFSNVFYDFSPVKKCAFAARKQGKLEGNNKSQKCEKVRLIMKVFGADDWERLECSSTICPE